MADDGDRLDAVDAGTAEAGSGTGRRVSGSRDKGSERLPFAPDRGDDDPDVERLVEAWRYSGPAIPWTAIVGHEHQVVRCRELVEKLARPEADLARLGLRIGRGIVIAGPPGVGKTLLARALASAAGRPVIAPPTAELTPGLISRLYAQLARAEPTVVILDEAERVAGREWLADGDLTRALCTALDGIDRPRHGPVTVALTTAAGHELSPAATRPGRLAPRLELGLPSDADRRVLLERAVAGLPVSGQLDLDPVVSRTAGWSGAELVVAVEEAVSRALPDGTDALRQDLLLAVVAERYVVEDDAAEGEVDAGAIALHEAAHALCAALQLGVPAVALLEVGARHGRTSLARAVTAQPVSAGRLEQLATIALAGIAGERVLGGAVDASTGAEDDRAAATGYLTRLVTLRLPYDPATLEAGGESDRGSERMRSALHAAVEAEGAAAAERAVAILAPRVAAIQRLARALLEAPDRTLSGAELDAALRAALGA